MGLEEWAWGWVGVQADEFVGFWAAGAVLLQAFCWRKTRPLLARA